MTEGNSPEQCARPEGRTDGACAPGDIVVIVSASGRGGLSFITDLVRQAGRRPRLLAGEAPVQRPTDDTSGALDGYLVVPDITDVASVADAAERLAGGRPGAILCWDDDTMVTAALAARRLGLPGPEPTALQRCRHKYSARRALRAAGLACPRFALLDSAEDAERVAAEVGMPAVIKPVDGTGSHLVRRVADAAELAAAYREFTVASTDGRLVTDPDTGKTLRTDRCFLVEGLLAGPEYSAEVIVRDGVAEQVLLLDKFLIDDRYFERGFCWPPLEVPDQQLDEITRVVDEAVDALGVDDTAAHVEILDDVELGPTIVEVNAGRPGGQIIGLLTTLGTGVDLRDEHLAILAGEPAPERAQPALPPPLATLTFYNDRPGVLQRIDGMSAVESHPDVVSVVQAAQPGDRLDTDHETFPVNVLVAGPQTREEFLATYRELDAAIHFVMTPVP